MLRRFPFNPSTVMTIGLFLRFKSVARLAHTKKSSFLDGHELGLCKNIEMSARSTAGPVPALDVRT